MMVSSPMSVAGVVSDGDEELPEEEDEEGGKDLYLPKNEPNMEATRDAAACVVVEDVTVEEDFDAEVAALARGGLIASKRSHSFWSSLIVPRCRGSSFNLPLDTKLSYLSRGETLLRVFSLAETLRGALPW